MGVLTWYSKFWHDLVLNEQAIKSNSSISTILFSFPLVLLYVAFAGRCMQYTFKLNNATIKISSNVKSQNLFFIGFSWWMLVHLYNLICLVSCSQGCRVSVRVTRSWRFLGEIGVLRTLAVGVRCFYLTLTPDIQLNHFLHCTPKLGMLTCPYWNGTISFETKNSCCVPWFPLTASSYKIVDGQTSFALCLGVRKFGKL